MSFLLNNPICTVNSFKYNYSVFYFLLRHSWQVKQEVKDAEIHPNCSMISFMYILINANVLFLWVLFLVHVYRIQRCGPSFNLPIVSAGCGALIGRCFFSFLKSQFYLSNLPECIKAKKELIYWLFNKAPSATDCTSFLLVSQRVIHFIFLFFSL